MKRTGGRTGGWLAALFLYLGTGPVQAGCATDPDPCALDGGTYHVILPADSAEPPPAVMLLHGWAASGAAMMKMSGLVQAITGRGYALILPDGEARTDGGSGREWAFMPDPKGGTAQRDENAFLQAVADDAARRFGLDRGRMLLSGFSIGGSMVHYLACNDPGGFAAYAPIAGTFWRPQPAACTAPVRLFHIHGWTDRTFPLEGRRFGDGFAQGDTLVALDLWRRTMGCDRQAPDRTSLYRSGPSETWRLREWTSCAPGGGMLFALHDGAHGIPDGWADLALDWFEGKAP